MNDLITKHVPMKLNSLRHEVSQLAVKIWHACHTKQWLYNHVKKTIPHKTNTTRALNKARTEHINSILQGGLDEGNSKPFRTYLFDQRKQRGSIAAPMEDGKLRLGRQKKAEILNSSHLHSLLPSPGMTLQDMHHQCTGSRETNLQQTQPNAVFWKSFPQL